jgi:Bacillus phage endonuclease
MRKCKYCGRTSEETFFYPSTYARCRECHLRVNKERYESDIEKSREKGREYTRQHRKKHPEKVLEQNRKRYKENPRKHIQAVQRSRKRHPGSHREATRRWREANPEKVVVHATVRQVIKKGKMERSKVCESCGATKRIEGHHFDYSKPLSVTWLCPACHSKIHHS